MQFEPLYSLPPHFRFAIFHLFYTTKDSKFGRFRINCRSWHSLSAAEVFPCDPPSNDGISSSFIREASVGTSICPPRVSPPRGSLAMTKEGRSQGYKPLSCKNRGLRSPRLVANLSPSSSAEMILNQGLKRTGGAEEDCWNDRFSSSCSLVLILSFVFKLPFKCYLSLWEANGSRCSVFLL